MRRIMRQEQKYISIYEVCLENLIKKPRFYDIYMFAHDRPLLYSIRFHLIPVRIHLYLCINCKAILVTAVETHRFGAVQIHNTNVKAKLCNSDSLTTNQQKVNSVTATSVS